MAASSKRTRELLASFAAALPPVGDARVSYTGLLRDGKMEALWFVAADAAIKAGVGEPGRVEKLNCWRSMTTSADAFERI
jgi:hypothetical protein